MHAHRGARSLGVAGDDGGDAAVLAAHPLDVRDAPRTIYDAVARGSGGISAEHGLGTAKVEAAATYKDPVELDLMRAVKAALDPRG